MEDIFLYILGAWGFFTFGVELAFISGNSINGLEVVFCAVTLFLFWRIRLDREIELGEAIFSTAPFLVLYLHFFVLLFGKGPFTVFICGILSIILAALSFIFFGWDFFHREKFRPPKLKNDKYALILDDKKNFYLSSQATRTSTQIIGASGSGKTVCMNNFILQTILRGQGTLIVDPKSNYIRNVGYYCHMAKRANDLRYLDVDDLTHSMTYNPLYTTDPTIAFNRAFMTFYPNRKEENPHFLKLASMFLSNLLPLLMKEVKIATFTDFSQIIIDEISTFKSLTYLCRRHQSEFPSQAGYFKSWIEKDPETRENELVGLMASIQRFVSRPWSSLINVRKPQIIMEDVIEKKQIFLFATSAMSNLEDSRPLAVLVLNDLLTNVGKYLKKPLEIPFDVYLDEFYNSAFSDFYDMLNKCREGNFRCFLAHQLLTDLLSVSKEFEEQIIGITTNKVVLNLSDVRGSDYYAKLFGTVQEVQKVKSFNSQTSSEAGYTEKPDEHFRFTPNWFRERGAGEAGIRTSYGKGVVHYKVNLRKPVLVPEDFNITNILPKKQTTRNKPDTFRIPDGPDTLTVSIPGPLALQEGPKASGAIQAIHNDFISKKPPVKPKAKEIELVNKIEAATAAELKRREGKKADGPEPTGV